MRHPAMDEAGVRRGLSMEPCGTPEFRVRVEEVWRSNLTRV